MSPTTMKHLSLYLYVLLIGHFVTLIHSAFEPKGYSFIKSAAFSDPNTGYLYQVSAYNVTQITTDTTHRSIIKTIRVKINEPPSKSEHVQTLRFNPTLVDFDLHCLPTHCYLVTVVSRTKKNVELYAWQRVQFDVLATRDSFARPQSVKLFPIQSSFYIAVAQEQLHLTTIKQTQEYEDHARFIGCAIFKFVKGYEQNLKYHQFIRLPYNPSYVSHFVSVNANSFHNNSLTPPQAKLNENHYLVFSVERLNWDGQLNTRLTTPISTFVWSHLNEYFWPYRLSSRVEVGSKPGNQFSVFRFPSAQNVMNLTKLHPHDHLEPIESCFITMERLLADRELYAQRLIDSSRSIWRSSQLSMQQGNLLNQQQTIGLTNISAQVIVYGNVIVRGSLVESPQITLFGPPEPYSKTVTLLPSINNHSPAIVEIKLMQASHRLNYMDQKLSGVVYNTNPPIGGFNSKVRFFGSILADHVTFRGRVGIANPDVRINGIPFRQLEHELVGLRGTQDIAAKVIFTGNVVADLLEIHGRVNGHYFFKDAIDITSKLIQVIDVIGTNTNNQSASNRSYLYFKSIETPQVILSPNATINRIRLSEFITRDNRSQVIFGRKIFKKLTMNFLDLAHPRVPLNGFDWSRLNSDAIYLRSNNRHQYMRGNYLAFSGQVFADSLIINNHINGRINISSLIHDSVKTNPVGPQQITGHKTFQSGLRIAQLNTEGSINGVLVNQMFNLNFGQPQADYALSNVVAANVPITAKYFFHGPIEVYGNLNAGLFNGIDLGKMAVRRTSNMINMNISSAPQFIRGLKIFNGPLHIVNGLRLLNHEQLVQANASYRAYPKINGLELRAIKEGIIRQINNPSEIRVGHLEIHGNINLNTDLNRTILGSRLPCPLDILRKRLVLHGPVAQFVEAPVRFNTIRCPFVQFDPSALNGLSFPDDFVLKMPILHNNSRPQMIAGNEPIEFVFGHKSFEHLSVAPSFSRPLIGGANVGYGPRLPIPLPPTNWYTSNVHHQRSQNILFGPMASINNITHSAMQTFILQERKRNSTGETVYHTLDVYGNILAKKINSYYWPEDILLKSVGTHRGPIVTPYLHKRIYSPLIFLNSSDLIVENQLVLRGPIQLEGRLSGVNLTEFAQNAATYGDKELLSIARPIRNKVFLGGLTVTGHLRSQGFIDGVNIDEMLNRVVRTGSLGERIQIGSPKVFLSDVNFIGPINVYYLNDLPIDHYLKRLLFLEESGNQVPVFGKKIITGTMKISKKLIVQGLINGFNFTDLQARAISLSPTDKMSFNKTLTIEGNVFMDNLLIDEKNGIIDHVKLTNLLPIENIERNELIIARPVITNFHNTTQGHQFYIEGLVHDCRITCSLSNANIGRPVLPQPVFPQPVYGPMMMMSPVKRQQEQTLPSTESNYPPGMIQHNGRNVTYMRTPAPYETEFHTLTPKPPIHQGTKARIKRLAYQDQRQVLYNLASRQPVAIRYERPTEQYLIKHIAPSENTHVREHLEILRKQIISYNFIRLTSFSDLVVGFIDSPTTQMANLILPQDEDPTQHEMIPDSFLQLDQIDFPFQTTSYHIKVGVLTNVRHNHEGITQVLSTIGGRVLRPMCTLPIESPNSAMFLRVGSTLFLLLSQDYTRIVDKNNVQCPIDFPSTNVASYSHNQFLNIELQQQQQEPLGGVHAYLFHALENSSSLSSAYFDLYQTINLPAVDSFESFNYRDSVYALAVSRLTNKVYVLILRGYSGFQVVSYINTPSIDYVKIAYTPDHNPVLVIYQSDGLYRFMESVII